MDNIYQQGKAYWEMMQRFNHGDSKLKATMLEGSIPRMERLTPYPYIRSRLQRLLLPHATPGTGSA
ncbi:MAG: hypothetical protein GC184_06210 [Rhizobiales bacterium]|nr:hypothetical protein [Hyphomicrobiales bacterium]